MNGCRGGKQFYVRFFSVKEEVGKGSDYFRSLSVSFRRIRKDLRRRRLLTFVVVLLLLLLLLLLLIMYVQ